MTSSSEFPALGTTAVVAVTDPRRLPAARAAVEETIAAFDHACSRFRDDSELTALNGSSGRPFHASPLLLEAVAAALRAARLTDGDVDPTVGQALITLGYDRDFPQIGESVATKTPLKLVPVPGWHTVSISEHASTITTGKGVKLDLGATAKALAADKAAEMASAAAACGVLVSLGGDIAVQGAPPATGWRIRVTDDHRAGTQAPGQWISLRSGGLATSSVTVRRWGTNHHLIDPATSNPAKSLWRTVSVAAGSCLDANIASTASIIRGVAAAEWLESQALPSRLVTTSATVVHLAGWPSEGDDLG